MNYLSAQVLDVYKLCGGLFGSFGSAVDKKNEK